jgi:hypothetical protein
VNEKNAIFEEFIGAEPKPYWQSAATFWIDEIHQQAAKLRAKKIP